jgi:S-adenosylmethionine:tRNA ribosyltransferase-isomerase
MAGAEANLSDFDYQLPPGRIAQEPARPRDAARLLVLDRRTGAVAHRRFGELPDLLAPGDLVVLNEARVIPAAFTARRSSGARIEGCFLRALEGGEWEVLLKGRGRLRPRETLGLVDAAGDVRAEVELTEQGEGGVWRVRPRGDVEALALLEAVGRPPLPPYIRRSGPEDPRLRLDRADYQTVYARRDGAVAAPTAGLHFTPEVLARLMERGIELARVTLEVGLGTFQPIRALRLAEHRMHEERFEISAESAAAIHRARAEGRRVVAVGTTTVRALESAAPQCAASCGDAAHEGGGVREAREWTSLFIYPPYEFRVVDALVTNFHLPRTTLLALVCAFAGREHILAAYAEAIRAGYRFYSYGDAMLIL